MALVPDHFIITVAAKCTAGGPNEYDGPVSYYEHLLSVELPLTMTKAEAREQFNDVCERYVEPDYEVELKRIVCRSSMLLNSKGKHTKHAALRA